MLFEDIVGQENIKTQLIESIRFNNIPHARLFAGPGGVGKLALAIAYAQYINCLNPKERDSCGKCSSCIKYNNLMHPDLHFVFPIIKKDKKEVCDDYLVDWRAFCLKKIYFDLSEWLKNIGSENSQGLIYAKESEQILKKLSLKVYEAKYKVMIIWLPEKMHEVCANKLLKIIEEPSDKTIFILVSDNADQVLTTIQSRCQRLNIHNIESNDIEMALTSNFNIELSQAKQIAHISNGSYQRAIEMISLNDVYEFFFELFIKMMRSSYARDIKSIKAIANEIATIGRERQKSFLVYCQKMVREYFMKNLNQPSINYLNKEEDNFGVRFAPFINEKNIIDFTEEFGLAEKHIEQNVNAKMVFFDLCLKITLLLKR